MSFILFVLLLLFVASEGSAATYYAQSGGANNSCSAATNQATPRNSLTNGLACLSGGDTLMLRGGTYNEVVQANALPSGSPGNHTILRNFPGEHPILRPDHGANDNPAILLIWGPDYITVDGINLDLDLVNEWWCGGGLCLNDPNQTCCANYGIELRESHDIIAQNMEIRNAPTRTTINNWVTYGVGMMANEDTSNVIFQDNYIHDLCHEGEPEHGQGYGFYFKGTDNIARRNRIDRVAGHGFHIYNQNLVNINMLVYDNVISTIGLSGILFGGSLNGLVYNNTIYDVSYHFSDPFYMAGIVVGYGGDGSRIINNTVYASAAGVVTVRQGEQTNVTIRNNLGYQNGANIITAGPGDTVADNFLTGNPLFVNAGAADFHLSAGSQAINYGIVQSGVTVDQDGNTRGTGVGTPTAAGVFEFGTVITPVAGTYYIATTGTDAVDCSVVNNPGAPRRWWRNVSPCFVGGSTAIWAAGTYVEDIHSTANPVAAGTMATPSLLKAATPGTVTLQSPTGTVVFLFDRGSADHHITLDGFIIDMQSATDSYGLAVFSDVNNITFSHGEIKNAPRWGIVLDESSAIRVTDSNLHHNGIGIYIGAGAQLTATGNTLANNTTGVRLLSNGTLSLERSRIFSNTGEGMLLEDVTAPLIANNLLYSNGSDAVRVLSGNVGSQIYNNTIWNNTGWGINILAGASVVRPKNNVIRLNTAGTISDAGGGTDAATNVTADPDFVSPGPPTTFHVEGPNVVCQGTVLPAVTTDFDGVGRTPPCNTIGAYQDLIVDTPAGPLPPLGRGLPFATTGFFIMQ